MESRTGPFRVAIIGCGLIGGSLLHDLRSAGPGNEWPVWVYDPQHRTALQVCDLGGGWANSMAGAVAGAQLCVVAAPLSVAPDLVIELLRMTPPGTTICDVSSVRAPVEDAVAALPLEQRQRFVGTHPLAGATPGGFAASRAELFAGAPWALTPVVGVTDSEHLARAAACIAMTGARTFAVLPSVHDRLVATTSHLAHLAAASLLASLPRDELSQALMLSGGGLADVTRICGGDPLLYAELLNANADALADGRTVLVENLVGGDPSALLRIAHQRRQQLEAVRWSGPPTQQSMRCRSVDLISTLLAHGGDGRCFADLVVDGETATFLLDEQRS